MARQGAHLRGQRGREGFDGLERDFERLGVHEVGHDGVRISLPDRGQHARCHRKTSSISVLEQPASGPVLDGPDGGSRLRENSTTLGKGGLA